MKTSKSPIKVSSFSNRRKLSSSRCSRSVNNLVSLIRSSTNRFNNSRKKMIGLNRKSLRVAIIWPLWGKKTKIYRSQIMCSKRRSLKSFTIWTTWSRKRRRKERRKSKSKRTDRRRLGKTSWLNFSRMWRQVSIVPNKQGNKRQLSIPQVCIIKTKIHR